MRRNKQQVLDTHPLVWGIYRRDAGFAAGTQQRPTHVNSQSPDRDQDV